MAQTLHVIKSFLAPHPTRPPEGGGAASSSIPRGLQLCGAVSHTHTRMFNVSTYTATAKRTIKLLI